MGPPCSCKRHCRTLLKGTEQATFAAFWDFGDYEKQNIYLFSTMKMIKKKRSYKKKQRRQESARKFTFEYLVKVDGMEIKICKQEFLSIHGLQNSKKGFSYCMIKWLAAYRLHDQTKEESITIMPIRLVRKHT